MVYNEKVSKGLHIINMPIKHQGNCYRNINGVRYTNHADLIYSDAENSKVIAEARSQFRSVRKIKHPDGYYQLFVANAK